MGEADADWAVTMAVLLLSVVVFILSIIRASTPPRDSPRARLISWPFMILLSGAVLVLVGVHLLNLLGIRTGSGSAWPR
jgi:hypothetical protein